MDPTFLQPHNGKFIEQEYSHGNLILTRSVVSRSDLERISVEKVRVDVEYPDCFTGSLLNGMGNVKFYERVYVDAMRRNADHVELLEVPNRIDDFASTHFRVEGNVAFYRKQ